MKRYNGFQVELETNGRGLKVVETNKREFMLYNHNDFPITKEHVKELKKMMAKEMRKEFKKYNNGGLMITVQLLNSEYSFEPLFRFTFENNYYKENHKIIEMRPYDEFEQFEVKEEVSLETNNAIREVNTMLENFIETYFTL